MDESYRQDFIKAGKMAGEARAYGKSLIRSGASYNEVIEKILNKISSMGGKPAFPPQIALDHVAAHFLPEPGQDIEFNAQVVKLDIGVSYNGAIGDCAVTVDLSGKHQSLIDAAEAALSAAEHSLHVGKEIRQIGRTIQETISSYGFQPIKNLSGHGLSRFKVHTPPIIPNYDNRMSGLLKPGMTFAIEPFVTDGKGMIYDAGKPMIFSFLAKRAVRSELAKELLEKIQTFQDLPFSMHDLVNKHTPLAELKHGLAELLHARAIAGYAPLIEEDHGLVAQAENSVLIDLQGKILVTTRI